MVRIMSKDNLALHKKAMKALRSAVSKVIVEHKKSGIPMVVWKNGKVATVSAKTVKVDLK